MLTVDSFVLLELLYGQFVYTPQVGAQSLHTGIKGAYYNVCINLKQVKDEAYSTKITSEVEGIVKASEENCSKVMEILASRDK